MIRAAVSRAVLVLWCAFACFSSPASVQQKSARSALNADEYAIYSLIVRTHFAWKGITKIVIQDSAGTPGGLTAQMVDGERQFETYVRKMLPKVQADTVANFYANTKETEQLTNGLSLNIPYFLVTNEEMKAIFGARGDGWDNFYKKYPGAQGVLFFSRVGFDRRRDQSLVYVGDLSGHLGGVGYLDLLAKKNGAWIIVKQAMLWIS